MDFKTNRKIPAGDLEKSPRLRIKSPEFQSWFEGSRAVGQKGEPLVLYHGTQSVFDAFSEEMQGSTVCSADVGFFFTNDIAEANAYATWDWDKESPLPNIMPVYLSIKNPLLVNISNPHHPGERPGVWYDVHGQRMAQYALDCGYDGLIVSDFGCGVEQPHTSFSGKQTLYVAFAPNQIKSAIGNNGNFDLNDHRVSC